MTEIRGLAGSEDFKCVGERSLYSMRLCIFKKVVKLFWFFRPSVCLSVCLSVNSLDEKLWIIVVNVRID